MALALVGLPRRSFAVGAHSQLNIPLGVRGTTGGSKVAHIGFEPMSLSSLASRSFGIADTYIMLPEVLGQRCSTYHRSVGECVMQLPRSIRDMFAYMLPMC